MADDDAHAALAIGRLESKIDSLSTIIDERLKSLDHKIEFGDRSALQTVQIVAESMHRLESNQMEQGQRLRNLDLLPSQIDSHGYRILNLEAEVKRYVTDRARIIGFGIGIGVASGSIGAGIIQLLSGG